MLILRALRLVLLALPFLLLPSNAIRAQDATTDISAAIQAMGEANLRELEQIVADLAATGSDTVVPVLTALGDGNLYLGCESAHDSTSRRCALSRFITSFPPRPNQSCNSRYSA